MTDPTTPPEDPAEIWRDAWAALARATHDRRHAYRHPVVAARSDAHGVSARTVVLREADAEAARLAFHSDHRSDKFSGLAIDPRVSWCFWDPRHRIQLRAETRATVHHGDATAQAAWDDQGDEARAIYAAALGPGTPLPDPADRPPAADPDEGFASFAVVACRLEHLDWLWLGRDQHRRLRFDPPVAGDDAWSATPVVP